MHFETEEECQMWSEKIHGPEYKCFKTYKYEEFYLEKYPLKRPDIINTMDVKED